MSFGTDMPVESPDPLACIDCAVRRMDEDGTLPKEGYFPREKIDVYTAVDAYTRGSAYVAFEENYKGRIRPGYLADLALLEKDIFTVSPEEIRKTSIRFTLVGGEFSYHG
jgi:predicted amidohydrolase YtcJ